MDKLEFCKYILYEVRTAIIKYDIKSMKWIISQSLHSAPDEFRVELKDRMQNVLKPNITITPINDFGVKLCITYMKIIQEIAIEELQLGLKYKVSAGFVTNYMLVKQPRLYDLDCKLKDELNVQSLLNVIGYSLDIAEQLDMPVDHIKSGIVGLKVINRVFSNQPKENFEMKDLGLAVEVMATAFKYFTDDENEKKYIGLTSMAFNLAIDFFVSKN